MKVLEHNIFDSELARLKESEYVFEYIKKNYKVLNKTYTPIRVYDELGNFYKDFPSHTAAAKEFNVLPSRIIIVIPLSKDYFINILFVNITLI